MREANGALEETPEMLTGEPAATTEPSAQESAEPEPITSQMTQSESTRSPANVQSPAIGTTAEETERTAAPAETREEVTSDTPLAETVGTASETATSESAAPAIPSAPDSSQQAAVNLDASTGRIYGAANTDARIVLTAEDDSWVQVRDTEGQLLLTRVLRAGDVYRVPNRQGLTLLTGNAGGLSIVVDGQSAPALGDTGEVVRDVVLDPQRLLDGTASSQ
jgi:cytoskeleton protein RodZ